MRISKPRYIAAIFAFLVLASPVAFGEIYTWVDETGKKHFGDAIPEQYKDQGGEYTVPEINTSEPVKTKQKKKSSSIRNVDLQWNKRGTSYEYTPPEPKKKSCAELKADYRDSRLCFEACWTGQRDVIGGGECKGCTNIKKPDC